MGLKPSRSEPAAPAPAPAAAAGAEEFRLPEGTAGGPAPAAPAERPTGDPKGDDPKRPRLADEPDGLAREVSVSLALQGADAGEGETARRSAELEGCALHLAPVIPDALFVSGAKAAADRALLAAHGVTLVVNVASSAIPNAFPDDPALRYLPVPLSDSPREDLLCALPALVEAVEAELAAGGRALVHCHQGVSRSCSVAMAVLMHRDGLCYDDAFARARQARPVCAPNAGFVCQLMEWGQLLAGAGALGSAPLLWRVEQGQPAPVARLALEPGTRTPSAAAREADACVALSAGSPRALLVWAGAAAPPAFVAEARAAAERLRRLLALPTCIVECAQGGEPEGFEWISVSSSSSSEEEEPAAAAPEPAVQLELVDSDGDDGDGPEVALYKWLGDAWERYGVYDTDDLDDPGAVLLLLVRPARGYLWLGAEVASVPAIEGAMLPDDFMDALPAALETARGGEETEAFWEAFEAGF